MRDATATPAMNTPANIAQRLRRAAGASWLILAVLLCARPASAVGEAQQPTGGAWEFLRAKYYGTAPMGLVDDAFLSIEAPANTPDPASTPVTLKLGDGPQRQIRRIRVFIDNNPSPLVATMDLDPTAPLRQIDLKVRIDRFTSVRAVAETSDGSLEMRSTWVKASGGCSAPPAAGSGGTLGEIRLHPSADARALQIAIRHPNNSGFQIDPRSGEAIEAHYISHIAVRGGGHVLLDADTGISLSENPSLRIASDRSLPAPLDVDALDSVTQAHYSAVTAGGDAKH